MFLRNKWWVIAGSKAIGKKPVAVRRLGEDLVLWRDSSGKIVLSKPTLSPSRSKSFRCMKSKLVSC
jgi:hypothetical protein